MYLKILLFPFLCIELVYANLNGPFIFFGPKYLKDYQRPALSYLGQDDLMQIYSNQKVIVVFNNQDSVPLSNGGFPRLRSLMEGLPMLVLPQDYLEVRPEYVSNDTQIHLLQGTWSDRDTQLTETFERLEDVYGKGHVLGILGNSLSLDYDWQRVRRAIEEESTTPLDEEERPAKDQETYAFFNASGPPGNGALIYSSSWPRLQWPDGTVMILDTPIGKPTVRPTKLYTSVVVKFADGDNNRDKIKVEFSFKQSAGWWMAVGVEVTRGVTKEGLSLQAPLPPEAPSAVLDKAYHCSLPLVYTDGEASLTLTDVRMQVFMYSTEEFADAFDCIGFFTVPIWSGLMVVAIMLFVLAISLIMIFDIKTMDKFENNRSKQLTITVQE